MDYVTILGLAAGTLTTVAFLPQVTKAWRTKSTKDISLVMFIMFCIGIFLWLIYGIFLKSLPIILANAITFILALTILILKIKFR